MTQPILFIDLHGVLVNTPKIFEEYRNLTIEHLKKDFQLKEKPAAERYDQAMKNWENKAFEYLRNPGTKKTGNQFLDFLENCDKLFPKYLYQDLDLSTNHKKLRTRPFEYSIASKFEALYPETIDVLEILLQHNYEMYVASSSHSSHISGVIEGNHLNKYLKGYFGFDTVAATKHTVKYYREMVARVNASPQSCIMIGNSMHEILKPRKLGMKTIHINRERKVPADVRRMADLSLDDLSSLPIYLDSLILAG